MKFIYRLDYLNHSVGVAADGKVYKDSGNGFKLRTLKEGIAPEQFIQNRKNYKNSRPNYFAYADAVNAEFSKEEKEIYLIGVDMMGDDVDGIWSMLDDAGMNRDCEVLVRLNNLRKAAIIEKKNVDKVAATN